MVPIHTLECEAECITGGILRYRLREGIMVMTMFRRSILLGVVTFVIAMSAGVRGLAQQSGEPGALA